MGSKPLGQFILQMQGHRRETEQVVTVVTEMSSTAQEVASSAANAGLRTSAASNEAAAARGRSDSLAEY